MIARAEAARAVLSVVVGGSLAVVALVGAREAFWAAGTGEWGLSPAWAACGAVLVAGAAAGRLARRRLSVPAFAASSALALASLHALVLSVLSDQVTRLHAAVHPIDRLWPIVRFFLDAIPAAALAAPPLGAAAFLLALDPGRRAARRLGLLCWGGCAALVLSGAEVGPGWWTGMAAGALMTVAALLVFIRRALETSSSDGDPVPPEVNAIGSPDDTGAGGPASLDSGAAEATGHGATAGLGLPGDEGSAPPRILLADDDSTLDGPAAAAARATLWRDERILTASLVLAGLLATSCFTALWRLSMLVTGPAGRSRSTFAATALFAAGLGALVSPRTLRRSASVRRVLGACIGLTGLTALVAVVSGDLLPFAYLETLLDAGVSGMGESAAVFTITAMCFLGPALFAGATVGASLAMRSDARSLVPWAAGAAFGAWLGGAAVSAWGLQTGLTLSVVGLTALATVVILTDSGPLAGRIVRSLGFLVVSAVAFSREEAWDPRLLTAAIAQRPGVHFDAGKVVLRDQTARDRVVLAEEGRLSTAAVRLAEGRLETFVLDGESVPLDGVEARRAQELAGHLPALIGPDSGRALVLTDGPAPTIEALLDHPALRVEVAAPDPVPLDVALAARAVLEEKPGPPRPPRLRVRREEAVRALLFDREGFDLITAPQIVRAADVRKIFSRRTLAMMERRLRPDGVVCLGVPLHRITRVGLEAAVALFHERFPGSSAWSAGTTLLLTGGPGRRSIQVSRLERLLARGEGSSEVLPELGLGESLRILALRVPGLDRIGAPEEGAEETIRLALAEARTRPPLASNLSWLASLMEPDREPPDYPETWGPSRRAAGALRLRILAEVQRLDLLAHAALASRDLGAAVSAAERALLHDPSDLEARYLAARALSARADLSLSGGVRHAAVADYTKAVTFDPECLEALTGLSWLKHEAGDRETAEDLLRRAVAVAPWVAILRYRLALVRLEEGDLDEAEALLGEAFRLDPRRPETVLLQGDVARRRGQHERAEEFYHLALSLGARAAETRTALAVLHLDVGKLDEASAEIEAAFAAKPGDAEALYTRARIRAARGDRDGARLDLLAAVTTGGALYRGRAMAEADLRALLIEGAGQRGKETRE